jgi:NAD(P)-dependent dehydrogenase (short-subunit alcohol dehydrogenase family)
MSDSRIIVLTGATKGLGRAMTERFIEAGHTVIGCGRSEDAILELQNRFGNPHRFDRVDVTSDSDVAAWSTSVMTECGVPNLLINNAATINRNAELWTIGSAEFDAVIDVNIKGVANVLRHFVPSMIEQGRGIIVNFSSGWGRSTSAEVAPYCATKWAIEGLTQAMADELPQGMAAIPLNPGIINTEMLQSCFGSSAQHHPTADDWSKYAAPYILSLGPQHNGRPLSVTP